MAFREGIHVFSQPGSLPAASLEQVVTGIRELDRGEIRSEGAARAQTPQS